MRTVHPRHPVIAATVLAAALNAVWALFLANDSGDLAAQYAWTEFIRQNPGSAYNLSWYGGMHTASYSLLSPYVMGWLGVRTTGFLAATVSATAAARLLMRAPVSRPLPLALCTAFALSCNLASGRVTFALGVTLALPAVALLFPAAGRGRGRLAAVFVFATLATMASPVAGLFLGVIAAGMFLTGRRPESYVLVAGPTLVVAGTSLLFPFQGVQPFDWWVAATLVATAVAVAVLAPREWRVLRSASVVYATGVVLVWVVPSPIGSNIERLPLLFAPTVLLAAAFHRPPVGSALTPTARHRRTCTVIAMCLVATWQVVIPIGDLMTTVPSPATARRTQPLIDELRRAGADRGRIEVVPLRSHQEAATIAPYVNLARGWNRQADAARNPIFYQATLGADTYHAWLQNWSVGFVVLATGAPDDAAVDEARIITAPHSWLRPIWQDADWQLFRVTDPAPLAAPPATVREAGPATVTVDVPTTGPVLLRIPWSPWLTVLGSSATPSACLTESGGWTELHAERPGTYQVAGVYRLSRGTPCPKKS